MALSSAKNILNYYDFKRYDVSWILRDISWSEDSKYMLQVNGKGLVEILSAADHDIRSLQHIPLKDTWSASFHREGHRSIAIGTKSGNVFIWDTKNKNITKSFPSPHNQCSVNHISYNSKNTSLAACMQNGVTTIYGLVSNIPVVTVKLICSKSISSMKFHHEVRSLLGLATEEGHIVLRDITTNKDKCFYENIHASPVSDFAYSLVNKDVMLSCGYDKLMHVYDVRLQNVVSTVRTTNMLTSLAINMENQVALGTKNGIILMYDLRDLTNPLKILQGHDDEIKKVAFQPTRRKYSTEISLKEESDFTSPTKTDSPMMKNQRTSFMLCMSETPEKTKENTSAIVENKTDSFLVMMCLDQSNNLNGSECDVSGTIEDACHKYDKCNQLEPETLVHKASTPLNANNKKPECFSFTSTAAANEILGDCGNNNEGLNHLNGKSNCKCSRIDTKSIDELKDFIKLNIADCAYDNRNNFFHIMMMLTKQKLYLQMQLNTINEQMMLLVHGQNALIESNQKLVLEVDKMKSQQNNIR